jgi:hypothetical protein
MVVELKAAAVAEREAGRTFGAERAAGRTFGALTSVITPNQQVGLGCNPDPNPHL